MHRFLAATALLVALVVPAPARAGAERAVATLDGYELRVRHDARGDLCLKLVTAPEEFQDAGECDRAPRSPFVPLQTASLTTDASPLGLAVPPQVTAVSLQRGSDVQRFDTLAVAGFGSRFALVPGGGADVLLRFYDAAGTLVGSAIAGDEATGEDRPGTVVFRARRTRVALRRSFTVDPNPLQLDRTVPTTCEQLGTGGGGSGSCSSDDTLSTVDLEVEAACAPARALLYGLLDPRVARAEALLGSGHTLRVAAKPVPAGLGPAHLVAASVPPGEAVRSVRTFGGDGAVLGRAALRQPPSGLPCAEGESDGAVSFVGGFLSDSDPIAPLATVATAGKPLLVADGPVTELCDGIGRPRAVTCGPAPVDTGNAYLGRAGRVVGGVLSKDVARVDFRLDRGPGLRVPTTDGPAYAGRYAGLVRFVVAALPAGREVRRAVARDAAGRRLGDVTVAGGYVRQTTRRRLRHGLLLTRSLGTFDGRTDVSRCVGPRDAELRDRVGVCVGRRQPARTLVSVDCSPRRALLLGTLPDGATGVTVRLRGGRRLRVPLLRFPGGRPVWALRPSPGAAVTGLTYAGRQRRVHGARPQASVSFRVAPASRQCGYEDDADPVF